MEAPLNALNLQLLDRVARLHADRLESLLARVGFTPLQFAVLVQLSRQGRAQRISDITRAMGARQPAITKIILKFTAMGLVETGSDALDKRSRLVRLGAKGHATLGDLRAKLGADPQSVFADWKDKDIARLQKYLTRLAQWYDANRPPPGTAQAR
jgi:DNA-binding MarR family transcriptional regulator